MTLHYHKNLMKKDGKNPLLVKVYGKLKWPLTLHYIAEVFMGYNI